MSPWLKPLNLCEDIIIGRGRRSLCSGLPEWAAFMMWSGWWMRKTRRENARIFMILLLPTRLCCSSLCSFGTLIGSMTEAREFLSWEKFFNLPAGTMVYWHEGDQKQVGTVVGQTTIGTQSGVTVQLKTRRKNCKDASETLFPHHLSYRRISLAPFLSSNREEKIESAKSFYLSASPDYSDNWMSSWVSECLLITNQAKWKREIEQVYCHDAVGNSTSLSDLLLWWVDDEVREPRVRLASPQFLSHDWNPPVAILDGPEAIKALESVQSQNVIILLEQSEYDEVVQNQLVRISRYRSDNLLPFPELVPETSPSNIEMSLFALDAGEH